MSWALAFTGVDRWIRDQRDRSIVAFGMFDDFEGIRLFGEALDEFNGIYFPHPRVLVVRRKRRPDTYGMSATDPELSSISAAAQTEREAVERTLVHELAHHISLFLGALREEAIASFREAQLVEFHSGERRFVSTWAMTSEDEYFAECWTAWFFERQTLEALDPRGYRLIEQVLETLQR